MLRDEQGRLEERQPTEPGAGSTSVRRRGQAIVAAGRYPGLLLALGWALFGGAAVEFMVRSPEVQRQAVAVLPYAALYVALSAAAFQLDGIFVGATLTREMRNASFYSFVGFLAIGWPLVNVLQNEGLWIAFTT